MNDMFATDTIVVSNNSSIDTTTGSLHWPVMNTGQYTITTANTSGYTFTDNTYNNAMDVKGDANFEGDIKIKGKSILQTLEQLESRLAILVPDPAKLEKYEALRKAYEHYKTLERLIGED